MCRVYLDNFPADVYFVIPKYHPGALLCTMKNHRVSPQAQTHTRRASIHMLCSHTHTIHTCIAITVACAWVRGRNATARSREREQFDESLGLQSLTANDLNAALDSGYSHPLPGRITAIPSAGSRKKHMQTIYSK